MNIKKLFLILITLLFLVNCAQEDDLGTTLEGNLNLDLTYIDDTNIEINWDNSSSSGTTLNIQAIVFDPEEHDSSMSGASQNAIIQIGTYDTENEENITVTASYYYVFLISDTDATYYDCAESANSDLMESFEICQAYLYPGQSLIRNYNKVASCLFVA